VAKKKKGQGKRSQARKEELRRKRKQKRAKERRQAPAPKVPKAILDAFKNSLEGYPWWVVHGLNYLASDYEAGTWTPLFEIYEGEKPPTRDQVIARILRDHKPEEEPELSPAGLLLMSWTLSPPAAIFTFAEGVKAHLQSKGRDPEEVRTPHDGDVWHYFQRIREALGKKHPEIK